MKELVGERGFEPPTPLVPKQQPITYIVDSLSLVLRLRPRFYPVFGSEWTQVGPKFSRYEFTRITLRKPVVSVIEIYRQLTKRTVVDSAYARV